MNYLCMFLLTVFTGVAFCQVPSPHPVVFSQVSIIPSTATEMTQIGGDKVVISNHALTADPILNPPSWLAQLIVSLKEFPVVGPYAVTVLQWLGVLVSILTGLLAFLLMALKSLSTVLNFASLFSLAEKIKALENSKVMYWLKYFSMFNATKPIKK